MTSQILSGSQQLPIFGPLARNCGFSYLTLPYTSCDCTQGWNHTAEEEETVEKKQWNFCPIFLGPQFLCLERRNFPVSQSFRHIQALTVAIVTTVNISIRLLRGQRGFILLWVMLRISLMPLEPLQRGSLEISVRSLSACKAPTSRFWLP